MFIFYKVFPGHDMVTNAVKAITWRLKFKVPSLQSESTKRKYLSKSWVLVENNLKISDETKTKNTSSFNQTTPRNSRPRSATIDDWPCNQDEKRLKKNWRKLSDQNCWNLQDENWRGRVLTCSFSKKSSVVMTWSLTLSKLSREDSNSKFHHYKQKVQKMKYLSKTWVLTGKEIEDFRRNKNKKHF